MLPSALVAQQQLHSLQAASANRRKVLDQLVQRTAATRVEVLGTELPNILRIQTLTLSHVKAMLEREQRLRLRQLTEIVPLRINAVSEKGGPIQITICNLRLPESGSTPTGGWPEPEVRQASCWVLGPSLFRTSFILLGCLSNLEGCSQAPAFVQEGALLRAQLVLWMCIPALLWLLQQSSVCSSPYL